jgi:spore photoproduct lyase
MIAYRPAEVIVEAGSWDDTATADILRNLPGVPCRTVEDAGGVSVSRDTLVLARHRGQFLKRCQGSGAEMCCNYFIASYAWNCHFGCTYCVLQSYLDGSGIVVATNIGDFLEEIGRTLGQKRDRFFRIGTGELADSLALDPITGYSRRVVPFFARLPNGILELKTKSDRVENLEGLEHGGRTVVSWSMNSRRICRSEEARAATLEERLAAADRCRRWGYRIGFHFDPIVHYEGWEEEYREVVRMIFSVVDPGDVAWISLGALRFTPHLRERLIERHPGSRLPWGEFVPGHHGKLRYFRPVREDIYRKMNSWIREYAPGVLVYLCMESRLVWERSLGCAVRDARHLSDCLDAAAPGRFRSSTRANGL